MTIKSALAALAAFQPDPVNLTEYDDALAGAPTQIVVLGTSHLDGWKGEVDRPTLDVLLDPLLDRLEAFAPDMIAIEAISGADCDHLIRYGAVYAGGASYCRTDETAQEFTGLDAPNAEMAILETLISGGPANAPEARRELAALFMAAGDPNSALVQWLRLEPAQRVAGAELSDTMVASLDEHAQSLNENVSIGVALAVRLGHERVYPVDDHSADQVQYANAVHYGARMRELWAQNIDNADEKRDAAMAALRESGDVLAYYRWLNGAESQHLAMRNDFALALADDEPEQVGRTYIDWWQVRNLRMTANIVAAIGLEKAERALAIVGSSHTPYYRHYLDQMHDIEVVDTLDLLAP